MKTKKIRKKYTKPQITQIKLEVEEAFLIGCKVAPGTPGKNQRGCGFAACKRSFGS